jgi:hypothetical protein
MKKALTLISLVVANVTVAFAQISIQIGTGASQGQVNGSALLQLLALAQTLVSRLVPFAIGVAVLVFFWFLINFIWIGKDNPEDQQKNLRGMGYSVLALFVMVSIWGIVGFAGSLVGINQGGNIPVPGIPIPTN